MRQWHSLRHIKDTICMLARLGEVLGGNETVCHQRVRIEEEERIRHLGNSKSNK